jgi:hypothetical protein
MTQTTHPSKEQIREFMAQRQAHPAPPPRPEEIRRQLGWHLIQAERETTRARQG